MGVLRAHGDGSLALEHGWFRLRPTTKNRFGCKQNAKMFRRSAIALNEYLSGKAYLVEDRFTVTATLSAGRQSVADVDSDDVTA